jgi:aldehyde:ferredoxin oxidoreductase
VRRGTCYSCVVTCKPIVEITEGEIQVDRRYGGPEYETLSALGSNCGVGDLAVVARANELVASLGLDSISCGVAIGFAMECYERGILTDADTGGIELRFGNGEALLQTIELIAQREGIGDLLAEGVARMSRKLGPETESFAMHVRGQEIAMHDPRLKHGHGLGLIVSPTGAEHQANIQDPVYAMEGFFLQRLQAHEPSLKPIHPHGFDQDKIEVFFHHMNWRHILDSLCICHFMPFSLQQLVNAVNSTTGWDTDISELMEIGERVANMARLYNVREGLDPRDEVLPQRLHEALRITEEGTSTPVDADALQTAKLWFFERMGWDERGVPTEQKLQELGLESFAQALPN